MLVTWTLWPSSWLASWGSGIGGRRLGGVRIAVGQPAADLAARADAGRLYPVVGHFGDEVGKAEGPGRSDRRRAQERR